MQHSIQCTSASDEKDCMMCTTFALQTMARLTAGLAMKVAWLEALLCGSAKGSYTAYTPRFTQFCTSVSQAARRGMKPSLRMLLMPANMHGVFAVLSPLLCGFLLLQCAIHCPSNSCHVDRRACQCCWVHDYDVISGYNCCLQPTSA